MKQQSLKLLSPRGMFLHREFYREGAWKSLNALFMGRRPTSPVHSPFPRPGDVADPNPANISRRTCSRVSWRPRWRQWCLAGATTAHCELAQHERLGTSRSLCRISRQCWRALPARQLVHFETSVIFCKQE